LFVAATERELAIEGRTVQVRIAGAPEGFPVVYFHGTPGSRLDLSFGDDLAAAAGVRLISFDRPGYGGSSAAPYSLLGMAHDALELVDELGVERFSTFGLSGGGPFALATGAIGGARVTRIGIASGAGPFQEIPGAMEGFSEIDTRAAALLPGNPTEAAATFASGFVPFREATQKGDDAVRADFASILSARDQQLFADPSLGTSFIASVREGLRPGVDGGGWDNVAWIGAWDFDVAAIQQPVLLWYGDEDLMASPAHAHWLDEHLAHASLMLRRGEGHFGIFEHLSEMLLALRGD
jgi:pimeloyl-ACP methyl ester carboxylesterase